MEVMKNHEKECECIDCTDFISLSSIYGCKLEEFIHLEKKDVKKLLKIMSRIMERAYRRGVQQTLYMNKKKSIEDWILKDDGFSLRYEKSLDLSIGLDGFIIPSIERLECEESLYQIGLG